MNTPPSITPPGTPTGEPPLAAPPAPPLAPADSAPSEKAWPAPPTARTEPSLSDWHRIYQAMTLLGIVGLAVLSTPVSMQIVDVRPAEWGCLPSALLAALLVAAGFSSRAHLRLAVAGIGAMFAVVAILGLLPICPDAPWGPFPNYYRYSRGDLLWRVAIGPTLFVFPLVAAFAWCGAELHRLAMAVELRGPLERPTATVTALTGDHRKGVLRAFAVTPIIAFGLFGLAATAGLMSHASYPYPQFAGFLWIFPVSVVALLLYGLFYGNHRETVLACGASAGLCVAALGFFGVLAVYGVANWRNPGTWSTTLICTPIVVLLAVCAWAAVALIPLEIPQLLPIKPKPPKLPPEEDLGASSRWDEASHP